MEMIYNPIKDTVLFKGEEIDTEKFKKDCFANGWEGLLLKVISAEEQADKVLAQVFYNVTGRIPEFYKKRMSQEDCENIINNP